MVIPVVILAVLLVRASIGQKSIETFIGGIVVWENGLNLHVRAELSVRNGKEVRFERMGTNYRAGRKEG